MNKSAGESHEVMAGVGVPLPMAGESAATPGGGGDEGRLTKEELAILEEAEKAAAKRAKKAEKKVCVPDSGFQTSHADLSVPFTATSLAMFVKLRLLMSGLSDAEF